ncbi:MAG: hypothetical protein J7575_05655, partial [Chloroflexi bacterium]|nr:hypothetical protein [Chloroflexota bacterium]
MKGGAPEPSRSTDLTSTLFSHHPKNPKDQGGGKMNTKKFLGALLALSVVVAMLAACAPKPTP